MGDEYRALVNRAKSMASDISYTEIEVRLHSLKALYVVAETTKQGTTSMVFSVRKEAERYRNELFRIIRVTKRNAWVKFRTADFWDESIQKPGTPDKQGNYLNESRRRHKEPVR